MERLPQAGAFSQREARIQSERGRQFFATFPIASERTSQMVELTRRAGSRIASGQASNKAGSRAGAATVTLHGVRRKFAQKRTSKHTRRGTQAHTGLRRTGGPLLQRRSSAAPSQHTSSSSRFWLFGGTAAGESPLGEPSRLLGCTHAQTSGHGRSVASQHTRADALEWELESCDAFAARVPRRSGLLELRVPSRYRRLLAMNATWQCCRPRRHMVYRRRSCTQ